MKRLLFLLSIIIMIPNTMTAQESYTKAFQEITNLIEKGAYNEAYPKAEQLLQKARQRHNSKEMLHATFVMHQTAQQYQEDATDSIRARYLRLLPELEPLDQALGEMLLARFYHDYRQRNRWRIEQTYEVRDDDSTTDDPDKDFKLWSKRQFDEAIRKHTEASLREQALLQHTPVDYAQYYCIAAQKENLLTTPTLYDLLMQSYEELCDEPEQQRAIWEALLTFHQADETDDLRIWLELQVWENGAADSAGLVAIIGRYRESKSEWVTSLYHRMAVWLETHGELVEALHYCDTAIARAPESEGGVLCSNMRALLLQKQVEVDMENDLLMPDHDLLAVVTATNMDEAFCAIARMEGGNTSDTKAMPKEVKRWTVPLPHHDDLKPHKYYISLPPLPAGEYQLMVSPYSDTKRHGKVIRFFSLCEAQVLESSKGAMDGVVLNRRTGQPIAHQRVDIVASSDYNKSLFHTETDEQGCYHFDPTQVSLDHWGNRVLVRYQGGVVYLDCYTSSDQVSSQNVINIYHDRPVYRPGDTMHFAAVVYSTDHHRTGNTLAGIEIRCTLQNVDREQVDTMTLRTDALGIIEGEWVLPTDAKAGHWGIKMEAETISQHAYKSFTIEYYKQPKFHIEMPKEPHAHQLGGQVLQRLTATAYSGAAVSDALVSWHVERSMYLSRYWWRHPAMSDRIASGKGVTNANGELEISFTAADEEKPSPLPYTFTLTVEVTDQNGETHTSSQTYNIGRVNSQLLLPEDEELESLETVKATYSNLDGSPLEGTIEVTLEKVEQPSPRLRHALTTEGIGHTMQREEFEPRFPLMAYEATYFDSSRWPHTQLATYTIEASSKQPETALNLPSVQEAGLYRVLMRTVDNNGDTIVAKQYYNVTPPTARQVGCNNLLWSHLDRTTAEVGEQVTLHLGSRFDDVEVFYAIATQDSLYSTQWLHLSNDMQQVTVPIDESMLGGVDLFLVSVKENVASRKAYHITVPYSHKKLQVTLSHFSDKLLPGEEETWSVSIAPHGDSTATRNLLLTLYDAALDAYGNLGWKLTPWQQHGQQRLLSWPRRYFDSYKQEEFPEEKKYKGGIAEGWSMLESWMFAIPKRDRRRALKNMRSNDIYLCEAAPYNAMAEEMATVDESPALPAPETPEQPTEAAASDAVLIRENLSTLGFFIPTLRTDAEGKVSFTFRAPEALTKWHLRGLAWDKELCTGSIAAEMVTQKPLMLTPGLPRFLREGDETEIAVKVSNLTEQSMTVQVTLSLTTSEALTMTESVKVEGGSSSAAHFRITVPEGSERALYKVVALTEGYSDGEQGSLPVVSNRESVTESVAMYLNGEGKKHYSLVHLLQSGDSPTLRHKGVKVECCGNPIWYAVQALPYVAYNEDPSNLFRAIALYAGLLGKRIIERYPVIGEVLASDSTQAVANFFNKEKCGRDLAQHRDKLLQAQRPDGGWSWIAGGHYVSEYITQAILQLCGHADRLTGAAMLPDRSLSSAINYLDRETYDFYQKWVKKHPECNALLVNYLYTRSFFPQMPFMGETAKAYKHFYSQAMKQRNAPFGLYTEAQIALILERHGDHKAALEVAQRILGKALQSDEMGLYWRDNVGGYCWNERPIEVQSLLIEVMDEVLGDREKVGQMQQWLLKQQQTTRWESCMATANAITALLNEGSAGVLSPEIGSLNTDSRQTVQLSVGGKQVETTAEVSPLEAAAGCLRQQWGGKEVSPAMGEVRFSKQTPGIAWGALYWEYEEELEKIPYSETGIRLQRHYYKVDSQGKLQHIESGKTPLQVGDRVRVRILIDCDRHMEYLELKDGRAACMEPVSTASGWHYQWHEGIGYYLVVDDLSQRLYIDRLDKGKYMVEHDVWVTQSGRFAAGTCSMQCLYAPAFRSTTGGNLLTVD